MTLNKPIVVADASPLIAFARIDHLEILAKTLGSIVVPQSVVDECMGDQSKPGAARIQKSIQINLVSVHNDPTTDQFIQLKTFLGSGESAAITLALKLNAGLLVDEKLARNAAAQLNIKIIGTAGVLLLAKRKKLIPKVLPLINQLKKSGYYLSQSLINEITKMARE